MCKLGAKYTENPGILASICSQNFSGDRARMKEQIKWKGDAAPVWEM